jgi:hypothetical protein
MSERTWQQIAEEASREHNSEKLRRLSEELERALDERSKNPRATVDGKERGG